MMIISLIALSTGLVEICSNKKVFYFKLDKIGFYVTINISNWKIFFHLSGVSP